MANKYFRKQRQMLVLTKNERKEHICVKNFIEKRKIPEENRNRKYEEIIKKKNENVLPCILETFSIFCITILWVFQRFAWKQMEP